jgi:predicted RNA-binding Zn-ribbon protein involved in translation (DUF1610 family)
MERPTSNLEPDDRANELYWGSDRSVNQIAEELDLSKGALYAVIRPLAAGLGCPQCGREVAHTNRTQRERGLVDCPACSWQGEEDDTLPEYMPPGPRSAPSRPNGRGAMPASSRAATGARSARSGSPASSVWSPVVTGGAPQPDDAGVVSSPTRTLATGALLGGAVGLALVLWARRR